METLGDRLRRIEASEAERKATQEEMKKSVAEEADARRKLAVREQFEKWKEDIKSAIDRDMPPPPLHLAFAPPSDGRNGSLISGSQNADHDLYLEFERWANDKGLEVRVNFADGCGGGGELLTVRSKA
jgi:hypothetical protein